MFDVQAVHAYIKEQAARIGPRAQITVLTASEYCTPHLSGWCYPRLTPGNIDTVHYNGPETCDIYAFVDNIVARCLAQKADMQAAEVRRLAHAIMDCMQQFDECTPTRLRGMDFDQETIDTLGTEACELAQQLADASPYVITPDAITPNAPHAFLDDDMPF